MGEAALHVVLLRYTQEPEKLIAEAAKLCYSPTKIDELTEAIEKTDQKRFIDKLLSMGHLSPIEHVSFSFGVEGISRACSHQLVRHRLASYSQQSQRYVGKQSEKTSRQFDFVIPPSVAAAGKEEWFIEKMQEVQKWYDELVDALGGKGEKAYEDARFLLPNATETKIIITMNARELLHFFTMRCCERAQWEIRELATEMLRIARKVSPNIFGKSGPGCLAGPCTEGKFYCGKIEEVRKKYKNL
ncbi:MAG TPA: FAD-dependent thymidylate synthase [Candidatus Brocadiia bacterium]|nr:FAD-dependent thymidylate synthase [Candidatus Brocadiales bacterium]